MKITNYNFFSAPVELIVIFKGDFDTILKDSLEKEWNRVRDCMRQLPYYFGDWGEVEARRCSIISSLKYFKDGDLILVKLTLYKVSF